MTENQKAAAAEAAELAQLMASARVMGAVQAFINDPCDVTEFNTVSTLEGVTSRARYYLRAIPMTMGRTRTGMQRVAVCDALIYLDTASRERYRVQGDDWSIANMGRWLARWRRERRAALAAPHPIDLPY